MKLFVGLGNPGAKYAGNRHNIGYMAVDAIADEFGFDAERARFSGLTREGFIPTPGGGRVKAFILKPTTYMNESGRSVGETVRFFKLDPADVFVFHDELDLAASKVRVKMGGGNAGHNGLKSISAHIGNDYWRVRLGIGHPGQKERVHGHVLSDFAKAERTEWVEPLLGTLARSARHLCEGDTSGFQSAIAQALQPPKPRAGNSTDTQDTGE